MSRVFGLFVLSILTVLSSISAKANESIVSGVNAQGEKVYLIRYLEDKVWRVEQIKENSDGWPDVVSRKYFHFQDQAEQAQVAMQKQITQIQPLNPFAFKSEKTEVVLKGGSLWPTTQAWSWDWEKKYAQWLTDNMNADFYKKYNIATDCADVAYSARWIFARINGLPAANHLSGGGSLMTNQSMRPEWASLPTAKNWYEDKRFRAALNYLLNLTYTHVLMRDSYPIAINPDNFLPGAHYLNLREVSGHTQLVHRVDLSDQAVIPFFIIQSTTPRQVRVLNESLFWGSALSEAGRSGFLRILWPKVKNGTYVLEKPENMPGYSLEQYDKAFIREEGRANSIEVLLRLKPSLNFVNVLKSGFQNLRTMFKDRLTAVEEGYRLCPKRSCDPAGATYDAWSTPSRDKHIGDLINQLSSLLALDLPMALKTEMVLAYAQELQSVGLNFGGEEYSVQALIFAWGSKLFSSDPNDEPGLRWGISPEAFSQKLQMNLQKNLTDRKTRIDKDGDDLLRANFLTTEQYCKYVKADQCLRFKNQELLKTVSIVGKSQSLKAWLEQTLWLNSDPKQTAANQWGALRSQVKFQALGYGAKTFLVSKEGIGFLETKNEKKLGPIGGNGIEEASLPNGFSWLGLSQGDSVGWAQSDGQLLSYDFKTQTSVISTLAFQGPAELVTLDSVQMILKAQGELWSFDITGGTATLAWHEPVTKIRFFQNRLLGAEQAGVWNILDFAGAVPKVLVVNEDLTEANLSLVNPRFIGVDLAKKRFLVNRSSNAITDITSLGMTVHWTEGMTKVFVWKDSLRGCYEVSVDANFKEISSTKFSDFVIFDNGYLMAQFMAHPPKIYKVNGENLTEVPMRADEEMIYNFRPPFITAKIKNAKALFRIRNMDDQSVVYEGAQVLSVPGEKGMDWVFLKDESENSVSLVPFKDLKSPALMTGQFFNFEGPMMNDETRTVVRTDKGLVLSYQGYKFWVEFP